MITFDFETRSACDLLKAGAAAYAQHPTTQVMCFAWLFDEDPDEMAFHPSRLWHRAHPLVGIDESPFPTELMDRIASGEEVEAHNAGFEQHIWEETLLREFPRFARPKREQWRCSAAKASSFALPRGLGEACEVLELPHQKDDQGRRIMLKLSSPRKPKKAERAELAAKGLDPESVLLWNEDPEDLRKLWRYCPQDVVSERGLSRGLRDLSPHELRLWQLDQRMNQRGVKCDVRGVKRALKLIDVAVGQANKELEKITGGKVKTASSRQALKKWVNDAGVPLPNTQAKVVEEFTALKTIDKDVKRVLVICRDINRTSTAKYKQMLVQLSRGDRLRDLVMYHGASTGRWTGKGVQVHNFIRGFSEGDMDEAWDDIMSMGVEDLALLWGSAMEVLSKSTRGAIVASEGKDLMVADFSAIEARALLWLAQDTDGLGLFHRGEDPYCDLAEAIYKHPVNKKEHPKLRQVGKTGILGLGFGMGSEKFMGELEKNGVPQEQEFADEVVRVYRKEKYPKVVTFWYDTEEAAISAVRSKGDVFDCQLNKWGVRGQFLHCRLPSGRKLSYFRPHIRTMLDYTYIARDLDNVKRKVRVTVPPRVKGDPYYRPDKRALFIAKKRCAEKAWTIDALQEPTVRDKEALYYYGVDPYTKKWGPVGTYSGKLVENVTQATARDLLADAMLRADDTGFYDVLMSVHDEIVTEVDEGAGTVKEFEQLVSVLPDWAEGCPVAAEGWRGKRYRK